MNPLQLPDFRPYGYQISNAIGAGHSGSVYSITALHEVDNMLVCKLVNLDSLPANDRRLAEQEVGILRSLTHKNIVRFHDCFRIDASGILGVVMEYCEHGDLRHVILEKSKLRQFFSEKQVMTWFGQIADGLRYIHAHRVIHRDLKSSNIFLKGPFPHTCLIGDFGISRILEETMAAAQTVIGTPYYLSPEVCKKEPYSYKSDIWSLGTCLYEMLTFKLPFRGSNLFNLVSKIINDPFESVCVYNALCTPNVVLLVNKLLSKDPQFRPSAAELMRDQYVRSFFSLRDFPPPPPPSVASQLVAIAPARLGHPKCSLAIPQEVKPQTLMLAIPQEVEPEDRQTQETRFEDKNVAVDEEVFSTMTSEATAEMFSSVVEDLPSKAMPKSAANGRKSGSKKQSVGKEPTGSPVPKSPAPHEGAKVYPQIELARGRVVHDEVLARDVLRGGGVLVKGERMEVWLNLKDPLGPQGVEEAQPLIDSLLVVSNTSSTESTPVPPSKKKAAEKGSGGFQWIKGTIASSNKGRYTVTLDLDVPLAVSKTPLRAVVVLVKQARWRLVEYVSSEFSGRIFQPRQDQKPSASFPTVEHAPISAELCWDSKDEIDIAATRILFFKTRRNDLEFKKTYSFKYSIPASEQAELEELRRSEREGVQQLNQEVKQRSEEIRLRIETEVGELKKLADLDILPLESEIELKTREICFERDEKTAGLEAMEGRTSGTGSSIRVQKKQIDDNFKIRSEKELYPLEKKFSFLTTKWEKDQRRIEAVAREEVAALEAKRDAYVAAVKARQQALRDKWKKLAEDDVAEMRLSQTIRLEKEWILLRLALGKYLGISEAVWLRGTRDVCAICKLGQGFGCQANKCDECFRFGVYEPKIEELELRVPWANNRSSAEFTPYHVYYHEQSRELRNANANIEPSLISQQCKEAWRRMSEPDKLRFEKKRQLLLLELVDNLQEDSELMESNHVESDEACTQCLSLRSPHLILQCDRTEGEQLNAEDERICGGMLHTYCAQLPGVPPGNWYCSWLCKWVQDHKPVFSKAAKQKHSAVNSAASLLVVDEDEEFSSTGGRQADSIQVKADVVIAKRNRLVFLLSLWDSRIAYFMVEPEKLRANLEAKLAQLDRQLGSQTQGLSIELQLAPIDKTPPYVLADMRPYQLEGLTWFIDQHNKGANSIMGDEMGLGKTLQTLSFFATLHAYLPFFSPFLVVCPLSVLPNWLAEAKRWTPQLNVVGLFGPQTERERVKSTQLSGKMKEGVHLIVTTYEILLTEITWLRSQFYFRYLVLDEAQKIKNTDALVTQACRQIRSVYRVLLTGTPLQNNMKELWSLLNFLYPECFNLASSTKFAQAYDSSTSGEDTSAAMIKDDSLMKECFKLLEPIMLRRLKQNVLAALLPPKTEIVLTAPLSLAQKYHYRQVLKTVTGLVRNVGYKNVSSLLWQLWKCCLHPFLFEGVEEDAVEGGKTDGAAGHSIDNKIVWMSGKMCLLDRLLTRLFSEESKCLVYSQYTSMLDIIEEYCQWRGWRYLRLDGSTSLARRRFYMNLFNKPAGNEKPFSDEYFVFLVSTKAGGVGVNLQAANSVILYDSSWNPFVDAQAEDRAHRMGQKKEVTVYRLITKDTCEERIRFFASQKLKMKQFVLNEDANGDKQVLEMEEDVSQIYSGDQLKDILEFGADELLKESNDEAANVYNAEFGEEFYKTCCDSLDDQLRKAKVLKTVGDTNKLLSPVKRNICIRKFKDEDYTQTKVERTTEMDWLDTMESEKVVQRNRKATTVTIDTKERGIGKIEISRWSIEQEEREREMMERDRARIEAKKIGGNKRVTEHDMNCLHCHESVLKQKVIVTTEVDEEGNEVKRRKIDSDNSGFQSCPICPATLHYACLRLAVHGSEFTTRSNCPQHKCRVCRRSASNAGGLLFRCIDCAMALCYDCVEKYQLVDHFKYIERENVPWESDLGYTAASTYEYMQCPNCFHAAKSAAALKEVPKIEEVMDTSYGASPALV